MRTLQEFLNDEKVWDAILYNVSDEYHFDKSGDENTNCNYELCKACGGRCCQRCGCAFSPDDFEDLSFDGLIKEIQKGYITLELVDADQFYIRGFIWLVRMRNVGGRVIERTRPHFGKNQCIALKEDGCPFDYAHRPAGGRLLIPGEKGFEQDCHGPYGIRQTLQEWQAHQKLLTELAHFIRDADFPCTI